MGGGSTSECRNTEVVGGIQQERAALGTQDRDFFHPDHLALSCSRTVINSHAYFSILKFG
jgi:hypothetical protein